MTTHTGKIGRLSKDRRHQLALRIEDGLLGSDIVHWLNQQPDVQQVLNQYFHGHPITEQNLSAWNIPAISNGSAARKPSNPPNNSSNRPTT